MLESADVTVTGFEVEVRHFGDQQWEAIALPATDGLVLNDTERPETVVFHSDQHPAAASTGFWSDQWHPVFFTRWNPDAEPLPADWTAALDQLVQGARRRHQL